MELPDALADAQLVGPPLLGLEQAEGLDGQDQLGEGQVGWGFDGAGGVGGGTEGE